MTSDTTGRRTPALANRVLAIAIDAAEWTLIERWARDGTMPHLKRLYESGARGRLISTVDWLAGTAWPSFYTGSYPPDHGFVFHLQWRPATQRHERPTNDWLPLTPFYRRFGELGKRVIAIDVPITYAPESLNGIELTSWSTHDKITPPTSYPPEELEWISREIGTEPITIEQGGLQGIDSLLELRDELIRSTRRQSAVCEKLMARGSWDFMIVALGAAHRAGHKLWDRSSAASVSDEEEGAEYDHALRDIYVACDETVGRIVRAAGPETTVLCFALHGMETNRSRFDLVPEMLERVLAGGEPHGRGVTARSRLGAVRSAVPVEWRSAVKQRLPPTWQDQLSRFWRGVDNKDWSKTLAFPLMGDLQALVQINLRGREREGIVEPGREYDELCQRIAEGLLTFKDVDTGQRAVHDIGFGAKLYPDARYDVGVPDLVIRWPETPAKTVRAVVSDRFGSVDWPCPGRPLDGRSGHHGPQGWLMAVGEHIEAGRDLGALSAYDFNATIHDLMGVPQPDRMLGEPIRSLTRS
jgi:predicted AlkP superfamily phosphohydrolase/phosphomutase